MVKVFSVAFALAACVPCVGYAAYLKQNKNRLAAAGAVIAPLLAAACAAFMLLFG